MEKSYKIADSQWPDIKWDPDAYYQHVTNIDNMDNNPVYLEDLYLSGAAGHRIDEAWIVMENEVGQKVKRVIANQPCADMTVEDLWGETLVKLMKNDQKHPPLESGKLPAFIIRFKGLVTLVNFCITSARRTAIQRHRKKKPDTSISDNEGMFSDSSSGVSPEKKTELEEIAKIVIPLLKEAFDQLTVEQQFLFVMVRLKNVKQKQAGAMINFSESKASRQLDMIDNKLQAAIKQVKGLVGEDIYILADILTEFLRQHQVDMSEKINN